MKSFSHADQAIRFSVVVATTLVLLLATLALIAVTGKDGISGPVALAQGTINVTTYDDQYNTDPGECSLREAIQAINLGADFGGCSNPGGTADTIQLIAGTYVLTIPSGSPYGNAVGDLDLQKGMAIIGAGSDRTIISQTTSLSERVFYMWTTDPEVVVLEGVTIRGGKAYNGGGLSIVVANTDASFTLRDVVVRDNHANGGSGGGIHFPEGCPLILDRVTVYNNKAGTSGGGIYYVDRYSADSLQLSNVTIYSNSAGTTGGGLYVNAGSPGGYGITATNVTIAGNSAGSNGGNFYNNGTSAAFKNSIIADGTSNDCAGNPNAGITSLGHNLDSDGSCGLDATGDITDTNPLLDSQLRDNGGSMETLALLDGSPALNQCADCPSADQRGWPRATTGPCDMGAYERWMLGLSLPMVLKNE